MIYSRKNFHEETQTEQTEDLPSTSAVTIKKRM